VKIDIDTSKSNLIVYQCEFLTNITDTPLLTHRQFSLYLVDEDSVILEQNLKIQSLAYFPYSNLVFKNKVLVKVIFDAVEFNNNNTHTVFFHTSYSNAISKILPITLNH
jgi:hypothetical protein